MSISKEFEAFSLLAPKLLAIDGGHLLLGAYLLRPVFLLIREPTRKREELALFIRFFLSFLSPGILGLLATRSARPVSQVLVARAECELVLAIRILLGRPPTILVLVVGATEQNPVLGIRALLALRELFDIKVLLPAGLELIDQGAFIDRRHRLVLELIAPDLFIAVGPVRALLTHGAALGAVLLFPAVAVSLLILGALEFPGVAVSTLFRAQGLAGGLLGHLILDAMLGAAFVQVFLCTYGVGVLVEIDLATLIRL